MKVLLISDIHSNWEAWQAVQAATAAESPDEVWNSGDLTGYGPDPALCVDVFRSMANARLVLGNHDRVVSKLESPIGFNPHAIVAAFKNLAKLNQEQCSWLAGLPRQLVVKEGILICHGSPVDADEYLLTAQVTLPSFAFMKEWGIRLAFFGHTHVPSFFVYGDDGDLVVDQDPLTNQWFNLDLSGGKSYLINPGSVGQPRDGDSRSAYAILELKGEKGRFCFHRVPYQIQVCQEKMRREKFPDILVNRLSIGY